MINEISELVKLKYILRDKAREQNIISKCIKMKKQGTNCFLNNKMQIVVVPSNAHRMKKHEIAYNDLYNNTHLTAEDIKQNDTFKRNLRRYGYSEAIIRFIECEILKELNINFKPKLCKCCKRKIYQVALKHCFNKQGKKSHCVECSIKKNFDTFTSFKPRWEMTDAFDLYWKPVLK